MRLLPGCRIYRRGICRWPGAMRSRVGRVLYITHAPPIPPRLGPARRHYHLLDQLARFYDVDLLSLGTATEEDAFAACFADRVARYEFVPRQLAGVRRAWSKAWLTATGRCDFLPAHEPELRARCRHLASTRGYDAIVLSAVLLRSLPLPRGVPVVGDTHNVDFDVLRRAAAHADRVLMRHYARLQWRVMRRHERWCARRVQLLLSVSDRDRSVFEEELGIPDVAVVPNGIDLAEFDWPERAPSAGTIVFTGLMSYYPNTQAVRWFLDDVFPLIRRETPGARLVIVGASPPASVAARAGAHVEVTGRVQDVRPYLQRAAVVVAPLAIGGGTRVKILEALAMRRPVVSTTIGAEGLGLRNGESIVLADDAPSFAARVAELLNDGELAARIAEHGRRHAVACFDWDNIGSSLCRLLESRVGLVPRRNPRASRGQSQAERIA